MYLCKLALTAHIGFGGPKRHKILRSHVIHICICMCLIIMKLILQRGTKNIYTCSCVLVKHRFGNYENGPSETTPYDYLI